MTNLEIVLLYIVLGVFINLIVAEIEHAILEPEEVLFGSLCWLPLIIFGFAVWIKKNSKKNTQ